MLTSLWGHLLNKSVCQTIPKAYWATIMHSYTVRLIQFWVRCPTLKERCIRIPCHIQAMARQRKLILMAIATYPAHFLTLVNYVAMYDYGKNRVASILHPTAFPTTTYTYIQGTS